MDTTELVIYAQKGNQQAITALYNLSYKPAYAVAFKMTGNEDDAFDVLQDAYIKAFNSLDQLTDPSGFIPWFNKITANKCRDFLRSKKNVIMFSDMEYDNGEDSFELEFEDESTAFQPEERADYSDTKRLVAEMLDNLPADQKMVLLMYYVQDMSIKEIAEALDISENTVKSQLHRHGAQLLAQQLPEAQVNEYRHTAVRESTQVINLFFCGKALARHSPLDEASSQVEAPSPWHDLVIGESTQLAAFNGMNA